MLHDRFLYVQASPHEFQEACTLCVGITIWVTIVLRWRAVMVRGPVMHEGWAMQARPIASRVCSLLRLVTNVATRNV